LVQGLLHPIALVDPQDIGTPCQAKGPESWDRVIQYWASESSGGARRPVSIEQADIAFTKHWRLACIRFHLLFASVCPTLAFLWWDHCGPNWYFDEGV